MTSRFFENLLGKSSPFIVAEISANHGGSIAKAKELIQQACECGADAIKLQTYTADTMTLNCNREDFVVKEGLWAGRTLYDLYQEAQTPFEWQRELIEFARSLGTFVISTPFDESAADLLDDLEIDAIKIASFEITDLPLIEHIAAKGRPIILSTGLSSLLEIEEAVETINEVGNKELVLLHCISEYPSTPENQRLNSILELKKKFGLPVGLSDHTISPTASIVATALGAVLIEKHFINDRTDGGVDAAFSINPQELRDLVKFCLEASESLAQTGFSRPGGEEKNLIFRRSLYYADDIRSGEKATLANVRRVRPSFGMAPKHQKSIIGKKLKRDVKMGERVSFEDFE